jgi:N-acetylneuraminate lyase
VEQQAKRFLREGVPAVFVGGTTGEFSSLTLTERLALTTRWAEVLRGTPLRLIVHVGANSLAESRQLAAHAQSAGAAAIAMLSPSYFKPRTAEVLISCCASVASAAPVTPFYFYDFPVLTGVSLPVADWIEQALDKIPTLAGVKFTNADLMTYQRLLRSAGGRLDVLYGLDEQLLAALVLGGRGAVGSGYNFAAPMFHRLVAAFNSGNLETARREQFKGVQLVEILVRYGYLPCAKELMKLQGMDLGPVRLPLATLQPQQVRSFVADVEPLLADLL